MQKGLSAAANVFKGDKSSSLTKEEKKRLEKLDKPSKNKREKKSSTDVMAKLVAQLTKAQQGAVCWHCQQVLHITRLN